MWSLVPAVIGTGMVIALAADEGWLHRDEAVTNSILHSMAVSHRMAHSAGKKSDFAIGRVQPDSVEPFVDLAEWKSEIVSGPAGKFLITWPGAYAAGDERSARLLAAMAGFSVRHPPPSASSEQLLGRFTAVEPGSGRVGNVLVPTPKQELQSGTPVIASILD